MLRELLRLLVLTVAMVPLLFVGCGDQATMKPDAIGSLTLPIVSRGTGSRMFILCQGSLRIQRLENSDNWTINAAEHTTEQSVRESLPVGNYRLALSDWQLCEATGAGVIPIEAQLMSDAQVGFSIHPLQTTYVSYSFMVQGLAVTFGGDLVIEIKVREGSFAGADAGGATNDGTGTSCAGQGVAGGTDGKLSPRQIAPLSTATVTSNRPTLRWILPPGVEGAHVELCRDRACSELISEFDALGGSGRPGAALPTGVVFWRVASITGGVNANSKSAVWQFTVGRRSAPVDTSWGTTLDVNGDGYADVVVGSSQHNYGSGLSAGPGEVSVYLGSAAGLFPTPAGILSGPVPLGRFGSPVASAGDVNGDGFADLIVGMSMHGGWTSSYEGPGQAYLYLGSPSGLPSSPSQILAGGTEDETFGAAVASAGDINGDGFADVLVGTPYANRNSGRVDVFLGGSTGLSSSPAVVLAGTPADYLGLSLASAGDLNGDGFGDIVIEGMAGNDFVGRLDVYLGNASGLASARISIGGPLGDPRSNDAVVASAGDVDGDGFADLAWIVPAHGTCTESPCGCVGSECQPYRTRQAYIYRGGTEGPPPAPAQVLTFNVSGGVAVGGAGDVNGDGFADLIVRGTSNILVYLGTSTGHASSPIVLTGSDESFGSSVAGAGDINDDGYADIIVAELDYSPTSGAKVGPDHVHIYLGSASGLPTVPTLTLTGLDPDDFFGAAVARQQDKRDCGCEWHARRCHTTTAENPTSSTG